MASSGSDKRQRGKTLAVRCTTEEFNAIAAKADAAGMPAGAWLRATALGDAGPRAQRKPPADHQTLRQVLGQLGKIGSNINQIAHTLNSGGQVEPPVLQSALAACRDMRDAVLTALGKKPGPES